MSPLPRAPAGCSRRQVLAGTAVLALTGASPRGAPAGATTFPEVLVYKNPG